MKPFLKDRTFEYRDWGGVSVCPQTWLNEARTNIGLSTTMNEHDGLAYFAILGELSSGLSFTVGFFKTIFCLIIYSWLFQGERKDIPYNTLMF